MLKNYIREKIDAFFRDKGFTIEEIKNSNDLIRDGFLDSFDFLDLIIFLENEFNIEITPEDTQSGVLRNYNSIIQFLEEKLK